jgi:hypothetical protein
VDDQRADPVAEIEHDRLQANLVQGMVVVLLLVRVFVLVGLLVRCAV